MGGLGSGAGRAAWTSWTRRGRRKTLGALEGAWQKLTGEPTNRTSMLDDCGREREKKREGGKRVFRSVHAE